MLKAIDRHSRGSWLHPHRRLAARQTLRPVHDATRNALTDARFDAIDTLGRAVAAHGAGRLLVAGDVFDAGGPDERMETPGGRL